MTPGITLTEQRKPEKRRAFMPGAGVSVFKGVSPTHTPRRV